MTLDDQILVEIAGWAAARRRHDALRLELEASHAQLQTHERRLVVLTEARTATISAAPPIAPPPPFQPGTMVFPQGHPFAGYPMPAGPPGPSPTGTQPRAHAPKNGGG